LNDSDFARSVFAVVRRIPKGKTLTYKQVAAKAGRPRAFRAVGNLMHINENPKVPCHRVIKSDGSPGGYFYGTKKKIQILKSEGAL